MKKVLGFIITLTLVFTAFAMNAKAVSAEVPANTCTSNHTVVVHYHRWDDDYTNMDFWSWGTGTDGSGNPQIVGEDDFGAVAYMCVTDDADANAGLIARVNDWSYKDGIDTNGDGTDDKSVVLKDDQGAWVGFDENGIKHVYVLQGSADVYEATVDQPFFQKDGFGTLVVVYYEATESYNGWNIWTWGNGTGGSADGVDFQWNLGIDQGDEPGKFKVAVINVAADADDTNGFIVRTESWEKQWPDDLGIDITGVKGSGTQFTFYIGGSDVFYDNFTDFEAVVNFFEIEDARALDPSSVEVTFNKDVVTSANDLVVFDDTAITLSDKDGNDVAIGNVSYDSQSDANSLFTLILDENVSLTGAASPYTVTYTMGEDVYTKEFSVDSVAPVITIIGSTNVELDLGDTYALPTITASDAVGDEFVSIYDVKVKTGHGTVDTRFVGTYEIVIVATDKFGNEAESTITVEVIDPCATDTTARSDVNAQLITLIVVAPLAVGAAVALKKGL